MKSNLKTSLVLCLSLLALNVFAEDNISSAKINYYRHYDYPSTIPTVDQKYDLKTNPDQFISFLAVDPARTALGKSLKVASDNVKVLKSSVSSFVNEEIAKTTFLKTDAAKVSYIKSFLNPKLSFEASDYVFGSTVGPIQYINLGLSLPNSATVCSERIDIQGTIFSAAASQLLANSMKEECTTKVKKYLLTLITQSESKLALTAAFTNAKEELNGSFRQRL